MAGFSYGARHLTSGDSFGQEDDVLQRSVDEDLDDLVRRNIRDVLQQVGVDDDDDPRAYHTNPLPQDQGAGPAGPTGRQQEPYAPQIGSARGPPEDSCLPSTSYDDVLLSGAAPTKAGAASGAGSLSMSQQRPAVGRRPSGGIQQAQLQQLQQRGSGIPNKPKRPSNDAGLEGPAVAASAGGSGQTAGSAGARGGLGSSAARLSTSSEASHAAGPGGGGISMNLDVPGQPEASLRLHKARIRALEDDLGRANKALLDREKQLSEALRELKELRTQAAGWAREKKTLEGQLDRAKKQAADAESLARNTESQVREMAKADSRAERERRASEAEVRARDVRLQRALEEVERYKQLLNEVRAQEREVKGSAQQDAGRLLAENRRLERQRGELIAAFKKQLKLIEVLKRQKVHLEAARALQFSEEEFLKTLEMGAA